MEYQELIKAVELELQWLQYYANKESREKINNDSSIYEQLVSIGYTKRYMDLDKRCAHTPIVLNKLVKGNICPETNLDDLFNCEEPRDGKEVFSAVEVFCLKYPDQFNFIRNSLQ